MTSTEKKLSIWGNTFFQSQSDQKIKPLFIPQRQMNIDELEKALQAQSKLELETRFKTLKHQNGKTKALLTPLFNTTWNDNDNNDNENDNIVNNNQSLDLTTTTLCLKRLPDSQLFPFSKTRKIDKEPYTEVVVDIKKMQEEYQQALNIKNALQNPSQSKDYIIIDDDNNNTIDDNTSIINDDSIDDIINNIVNQYPNETEAMIIDTVNNNNNNNNNKNDININENENNKVEDILEDILGETDYSNNDKLLIPTTTKTIKIKSTTNFSPSPPPRRSSTSEKSDTADTQPSTPNSSQQLQQQLTNEQDEINVNKCLSNIKDLPHNVVPVFPTKIQMDAVIEDLLEAKKSLPMNRSNMKKHILKCIDILNHPAIPLVKGHEEAVNDNWKGSGKTAFLEQLSLRLEKEYKEFHMVIVCNELTMEEQLISIFEKRYIVQRISMVMDDEWGYDYGVVAKIRQPAEAENARRSLLPKNVDLVIMIDPRNQVKNESLISFKKNSTLTGPPQFLHLVSVNSIEHRLYQYIKENELQHFKLPDDDDSLNALTDTSEDFALVNRSKFCSKAARHVIRWIKRKNNIPYTFRMKKLPKLLNNNEQKEKGQQQKQIDNENQDQENEVLNVDGNNNHGDNNNIQYDQQPVIEKEVEEDIQKVIEKDQPVVSETESVEGVEREEGEVSQKSQPEESELSQLAQHEPEQVQAQKEEINNIKESPDNIVSPILESNNDTPLIIPDDDIDSDTAAEIDFYDEREKLDLQTELEKLFSNTSVNRLKKEIKSLSHMIVINKSPELNPSDSESFYSATSDTASESPTHQLNQTMKALQTTTMPTIPRSLTQSKLRELKSKFDNECLAIMEKLTVEYENFYINLQKEYMEKCSSDLGLPLKTRGRK